jgi:MFS transporter, DHA1 family, multidrug resistance protein
MTQPVMSPRKTSAVGALLVALGPISMALYTPAMPTLVDAFGTDVATVKLTLTVYFLGFALAQLVCGPLSDALGRRPVVVGFTALYLAGSLLAVFAPSIEWLLAARAVQGTGAAAGVAISRAIVRDLFVGQKSVKVMNMIGLMLAAGPALSPTIGGITLDLLGWHAIFVVMIAYGVLVIAVFLSVVPETLAAPDPVNARPSRLLKSYRTLITDPRFLRPAIVMASTIGGLYTLATILPFVLIDEVGLTPTEFGVGMLAQSGAFMAGSLVMRHLLRFTEAHRLVPIGLGLICLGAALLPIGILLAEPSFVTVMGPIGVFACGIAFVMPSMLTESLAPFPRIAGAAAALSGFFQMAGGLVGSAAAAGMGAPLLALAVIVPAMAAIALVAQLTLRHATSRMEQSVSDRLLEPRAPAE